MGQLEHIKEAVGRVMEKTEPKKITHEMLCDLARIFYRCNIGASVSVYLECGDDLYDWAWDMLADYFTHE